MTWWERLGWHRGEMQVNVGCGVGLLLVIAALVAIRAAGSVTLVGAIPRVKMGGCPMAKRGRKVTFHGAFGSKAKAEAKERRIRGAFIRTIRVRGQRRFVVMTRRRGA